MSFRGEPTSPGRSDRRGTLLRWALQRAAALGHGLPKFQLSDSTAELRCVSSTRVRCPKCGVTLTTMCISFAIQADALPASSPPWFPDRYRCHKLSHLPFCGTHSAADVLQTKGQTLNLFW